MLPFAIRGAGWTKASDHGLIGEDRGEDIAIAKDLHDQLYSPGYNSFIEGHGIQLYRILENWVRMVEEGKWEVNENGVAGGIEKFKEADTEQHWEDYIISESW